MTGEPLNWQRRREAVWHEHHEAWKRGALNQHEYCALQKSCSRRLASGGRYSRPSRNRRRAKFFTAVVIEVTP